MLSGSLPRKLSIDLRAVTTVTVLAAALPALAQSVPPPRFAAPNLSPDGVRSLAANCAQCHGTEGHPVPGSVLQALAGRPRAELVERLETLKAGREPATVMDQIAKGYSDDEIAALADYFARRGR